MTTTLIVLLVAVYLIVAWIVGAVSSRHPKMLKGDNVALGALWPLWLVIAIPIALIYAVFVLPTNLLADAMERWSSRRKKQ